MEKKKLVVRVTAVALALVTGLVIAGETIKLNREKSNELTLPEETVITTVTEVETPNQIEEVRAINVEFPEYKGYEKISLEQLNNNFYNNISKFDNNIQKMLIEIYNGLVNNMGLYKHYMRVCGFPNTLSYINEKFVKPLGTVDFIKEIKTNDPDYNHLIYEYGSSCYVPEENGIYLFDASYIDEEEMRLILGEEVAHVTQENIMKMEGYGDYSIAGEGKANEISAMQKDTISTENLIFFYKDYDPTYICEIHGLTHQSNVVATKYHAFLNILVGYETIEKWEETDDCSILENAIAERFGNTEFYTVMYESMMRSIYDEYFEYSDSLFETERQFYDMFHMMVKNVKTEEEAIDMIELYRYLNLQYGIHYFDYSENEKGIDIIDQMVDRTDLEDDLFIMANKYSISLVDGINKLDRNIFNAYINPNVPKTRDTVPVLIDRKNIGYDEETNTLYLVNNKSFTIPVNKSKQNNKLFNKNQIIK